MICGPLLRDYPFNLSCISYQYFSFYLCACLYHLSSQILKTDIFLFIIAWRNHFTKLYFDRWMIVLINVIFIFLLYILILFIFPFFMRETFFFLRNLRRVSVYWLALSQRHQVDLSFHYLRKTLFNYSMEIDTYW